VAFFLSCQGKVEFCNRFEAALEFSSALSRQLQWLNIYPNQNALQVAAEIQAQERDVFLPHSTFLDYC